MYKTIDAYASLLDKITRSKKVIVIAVEIRHAIHFLQEFRARNPQLEPLVEAQTSHSSYFKNDAFIQVRQESDSMRGFELGAFDFVLVDGRICAGNWEENIRPYVGERYAWVTL